MSYISKCDCGKLSSSMNDLNWSRHVNSCKVRKFKRNSHDIKSFFSGSNKKSKLTHQITDAKNTLVDLNNDLNEEPVHKECSIERVECELQQDTEINTCLENKSLVDLNNDLNEEPVHKESSIELVECELQQDTEINTCLENKGIHMMELAICVVTIKASKHVLNQKAHKHYLFGVTHIA
ncbi:uncharacterized protein LOC132952867 [Metopolophium dirhodum]|uniref:uncharacterized protein LOC132952867 n=1 Tax=Metopolophium dirhodum TaxID=44670 RepID=UPI00298FBA3F|nr:uncharacterized protein LOC132952867 [Metopolophium dirhodum]